MPQLLFIENYKMLNLLYRKNFNLIIDDILFTREQHVRFFEANFDIL